MNPAIASDLYRYAGKADFRALVTHLIFTPGFKFIFVFRKANGHRRGSLRWLFYRLLQQSVNTEPQAYSAIAGGARRHD